MSGVEDWGFDSEPQWEHQVLERGTSGLCFVSDSLLVKGVSFGLILHIL